MSLFSTLNTGVTGLSANSAGMSVIGDNIANVNTVGYKSSRVSFEDMLSRNAVGSAGVVGMGRGVAVGGTSLNFAQGAFESSSNVTDMAINGQGFFALRKPDNQEKYYTRDGQFLLTPEGSLVTTNGYILQGYNADDRGNVSTVVSDLKINTGIQAPLATEVISMTANLDSDTVARATADVFDTTESQFFYSDLDEQSDFSSSVTVYDSLGEPHDVTLFFQKTGENTWQWLAAANTVEVAGTDVADGDALQLASGELVFNSDGTMDTAASTMNNPTWGHFEGADAQDLSFDFLDDGLLTQYGQPSALTGILQDGFAPGYLSYLDIDENGFINGIYSNGQRQALGQVAVATFQSSAGLERRGNNMMVSTADSKAPIIGAANSGGRGSISPYSLELSNVDLEAEFVHMISTQLGYQANSRVISTTNEMMQNLMQVV